MSPQRSEYKDVFHSQMHNTAKRFHFGESFSCLLSWMSITENFQINFICNMGYAVAQLVEALRYKSEGRGFDSRLCHWNFSFT